MSKEKKEKPIKPIKNDILVGDKAYYLAVTCDIIEVTVLGIKINMTHDGLDYSVQFKKDGNSVGAEGKFIFKTKAEAFKEARKELDKIVGRNDKQELGEF